MYNCVSLSSCLFNRIPGLEHLHTSTCTRKRTCIKMFIFVKVFMCYGLYTNLELLEHYGFLLEDNPHETVIISLKHLGLKTTGDLGQKDVYALSDGSPSWEALKQLRLASATPLERAQLGHLAISGSKISDECEDKAIEMWKAACVQTLAYGAKSLEEDLEELNSIGPDQARLRLAVTWRIVQKKILQKGAKLNSGG